MKKPLKRILPLLLALMAAGASNAVVMVTVNGTTWMQNDDGSWTEVPRVEVAGQREERETEQPTYDYGSAMQFLNNYNRSGVGMPEPAGGGGSLAEPPSEDNSKISCPTTKPVLVTTGEKIKSELDFASNGLYGLSLTRTYRSQKAVGSLFGPNWMSSLDFPQLVFGQKYIYGPGRDAYSSISVVRPDGTKYLYQASSFSYEEQEVFDKRDRYVIGATYAVRDAVKRGTLFWDRDIGYRLEAEDATYWYSYGGALYKVTDHVSGLEINIERRADGIVNISNNAGQSVQLKMNGANRVAEARDPAGSIWKYEYNANGMLTKVISPNADRDIREYHYEETSAPSAQTLLTGISFNGIRYSRYSYYPDGRVRQSALEGGEDVDNFSYGSNETTVTDAKGKVATYAYAPIQGDLKITKISTAGTSTCAAAAAETVYDANGYVDYMLDWKGNKTDYEYDVYGRLQSVITAAGTAQALTKRYGWIGNQTAFVDYMDSANKPYLQISYTYNGGRLESETTMDLVTFATRRVNYSYSIRPNNTVESVTTSLKLDSGTSTSTVVYDEFGNMIKRTNPMGHTEHWSSFTGLGQARDYVDANGVTLSTSYDERGLAVTKTAGGARTTRYEYEPDRQIKAIYHPEGRVVKYKYNAARRMTGYGTVASNGVEQFVETTINMGERSVKVQSPRNVPMFQNGVLQAVDGGKFGATTIFDSEGRPYDSFGNNGQQLQKRYDVNGNLKTVTDSLNRTTTYDYDSQNRISRVTTADGKFTELQYDGRGNLKTVIDPRGLQTKYDYNNFGELIMLVSPDAGTTTYTYDAGGRRAIVNTADGRATNFSFDALGRPLSKCVRNECQMYTYDEGLYGKGRLTRFNDGTGNTQYVFNAFGQVTGQRNDIYGQVFNTTWNYDAAGRLASMVYPTGLVLHYEYDSFGRRTAIKSGTVLKAKN